MEHDSTRRTSAARATFRYAGVIFWVIVTLLPIIGIILSLIDPISFYSEQSEYREFARKTGVYGPLAFIGLQALQVVITPFSHYSVGFMGGFLYGTLWGSVYNWLGRVIGHVIAFWLARKVGRPIVEKYVPAEARERYDKYVSRGYLPLFLVYFLPLFPDDEVSYLAGISKMRFSLFILANLFGHLGGSVSLAYLGSGVNTKDPLFWVLTAVTILGFPLLWYVARRTKSETEAR